MKRLIFLILFLSGFSNVVAQVRAFPLKNALWQGDEISVCWDNPTPRNAALRLVVKRAITETWEKHSGLKFTDWCPASEKNGDIHIYINDEGPRTKELGKEIRFKKKGIILNFSFIKWNSGCRFNKIDCIKSIAVHEFGHALGFAHQQNRNECSFPNCLGQEQGKGGDWYITPCDTTSVMNYCNPAYNNDGQLSKTDIQALQSLYGKPMDSEININSTSNFYKRKRGNDWYDVKVYLGGTLKDVKHVEYLLHETFEKRVILSTDINSNFGLGLRIWGSFSLKALLIMKDGSTRSLTHKINPGNLPDKDEMIRRGAL